MDKDISKIVERAQKMLRLADSTNFEHEAATAMRMVGKLLATYNLKMSDVEEKTSEIYQNEGVINYNKMRWHQRIYQATGRLYSCVYIVRREGNRMRHIFVGKDHNIIVTQSMCVYLIATIRRLCKDADLPSTQHETSFCSGAAASVHNNIVQILDRRAEEIAAAEAETQTETSSHSKELAVVMENELQDAITFVNGLVGVTRKAPRGGTVIASSYDKGKEAGKCINLNTQIN